MSLVAGGGVAYAQQARARARKHRGFHRQPREEEVDASDTFDHETMLSVEDGGKVLRAAQSAQALEHHEDTLVQTECMQSESMRTERMQTELTHPELAEALAMVPDVPKSPHSTKDEVDDGVELVDLRDNGEEC